MSETFPGMPPAPGPARPKDAAAVVMVRPGAGGSREVFWLRRDKQVSFGGFYAFPGGKVDPSDAQTVVAGATGLEAQLRAAAARELFEETGVLLARGAQALPAATLSEARHALLERRLGFGAFLTQHRLTLHADDFAEAGRWITPPFMPVRFDARFFWVEVPPGQTAQIVPGEHSEGEWIRPSDALTRWEAGTALLHPPNLLALQVLSRTGVRVEVLEQLRSPAHAPGFVASRIEFQQGIRMFPLETATLPPAAHTHAYVLGNGELLVVDPGAAEVRQYARLLALVAGLKAEGKRVKAVVLTHHHGDHVGGAQSVAERLKAPIWCHEWTAERLKLKPERLLKDGEVLTLAGLPTMKWRVLHTPGHARGHVCLYDESSRALIAGDMVAGMGTIVIDPPEGDMTDYLEQLRRLKALPVGTLYPAHGPAIPDGVGKLDEYLRHREEREKKILHALAPIGSTLQELVAKAYADTPPFLHPVAERSTQAVLIKLVRESKVQRKEDRYYPAR